MTTPESQRERIEAIQCAIQDEPGLDGWLFYDFRKSDPLAYRVLLLDPETHVTRRWYYWVPAEGAPIKLLHRIEPHVLHVLPGEQRSYVSWRDQHAALEKIVGGTRRIAMQYSPLNAIPYVSRVDAGTIELLKGFGIDIVTSADLVQRFEAVWNARQLESHRIAAEGIRRIVDEAFQHVGVSLARGQVLTEYDLQHFIVSRFDRYELVTSSYPIVAVNEHSADPHYGPSTMGSARIRPGDLVLIDLWAKQSQSDAVYADITWTGYVGDVVPSHIQQVFHVVKDARNAALEFVTQRVRAGTFPCGWEVDDACRDVIVRAGYGDRFVHRTGHSIGVEVHGNGANIDNLETQDGRRLMPCTCFSIEPGVYLPGEFGIRSELDVYLSCSDALVFGQPLQSEVVPIHVPAA